MNGIRILPASLPGFAALDQRYVRKFEAGALAPLLPAGSVNYADPLFGVVGADGNTPVIALWRVNGTRSAPTATVINDVVGSIFGGGYNGTALVNMGGFRIVADENATSTANGSSAQIRVVTLGSTAQTAAFIVRRKVVGVVTYEPGTANTDMNVVPSRSGQLRNPSDTQSQFSWDATGIAFFGVPTVARPTIVGSRASGAAFADFLTKVSGTGLFVDATTP